jgi:hypothetical protein
MASGKGAALGVVGVCVILAGCVGFSGARSLADRPAAARPASGGADPRLPAAAAAPNDIPLVPVPPPPLGRKPQPGPVAPASAPPSDGPPPAAPAPAAAPPAAPPAAPAGASLRELHKQAADWYAGVDSYVVRLTRREEVGGKAQPQEVLAFRFRKQPWSVYLKWVGEEGKGREVVYVKGRYENKIHTKLAPGDPGAFLTGGRVALALDNPMVRSASRHAITDAGFGSCIDHLGAVIDAQEKGDGRLGTVKVVGPMKRPEFAQAVPAVEHTLPSGLEADLPRGGRRLCFFDPDNHLPMLVITYDDQGKEVEYYHYDRLIAPAHLDDADFDPDKLWNNPRGGGK